MGGPHPVQIQGRVFSQKGVGHREFPIRLVQPEREGIGILAAHVGHVTGQTLPQQSLAFGAEVARLGKYLFGGDFRAMVVHVHQVGQPHNLLVGIVHGRGRQENEPHILGVFSNQHQIVGRGQILVVPGEPNVVHLVNDDQVVVEHGLDFTDPGRVRRRKRFERHGNLVGEFDVALEFVVRLDDRPDVGDELGLVHVFQMRRIDFI